MITKTSDLQFYLSRHRLRILTRPSIDGADYFKCRHLCTAVRVHGALDDL
jgi:hypothetical protein